MALPTDTHIVVVAHFFFRGDVFERKNDDAAPAVDGHNASKAVWLRGKQSENEKARAKAGTTP